MCTELILAIIYFIIIFIVNLFLYKLLKNYFDNIKYLLKIKNIFSNIENKNENLLVEKLYQILSEPKNLDSSLKKYRDVIEKQYFLKKSSKT